MTNDTKPFDPAQDRLPLTTLDPADDLLAQLREAAPQVFSEGRIDLDKLKAALGEHTDPRIERYGLNWAGKSDAFRNVQQPSVGTLLPMPGESVDWDSTGNLIIEGDNLEVLKLLQKPYHGKVKMIYIDPPYNTGNEFIYPDNYREGLDDYLRYSGQVSDEGIKQSTNTETSGRFHSNWLNMMYPRLFLASNLLRDDGVIFVSIDDNEVHNLRMLMNEVFGEESFIAEIAVVNNLKGRNDRKNIATAHEYVLMFCKAEFESMGLPLTEKQLSEYKEKNDDGISFQWRDLRKRGGADTRVERPKMYFPFYANPISGEVSLERTETNSIEIFPKKSDGTDGCWRWGVNTVLQNLADILAFKVEGKEKWNIYYRVYLEKDGEVRVAKAKSIWLGPEFSTDAATKTLRALMPEVSNLTPKPVELVKYMALQSMEEDDICLDFFAGSGTTAHALLDLNRQDGKNRQFILVQLPEKTDNPQYPTIADITRERVRRVIAKLNQADEGQLNLAGSAKPDRGFRAFKLSSSNFKIWDAAQASTEPDQLALQLQHYTDNVDDARSQQDILYELILKAGLPLAAKVEQVAVDGKPVFSVAEGQLLICLENPITLAVLRGMMAREPLQILCLDTAFHGNDPLKTNTVLEAQSHGITFRTV